VFLVYEKEVFMGNFDLKVKKFLEIFIAQNGYVKVVEGLQNTIMIAVLGLLIGIVIGTIIAAVRVMPKYKVLPRVLNAVCSFYVGLFRGTPMVVQLLVFYYVMLPLMGIRISGLEVAILVFGLNSGAYISEIMRGGILSVDGGQMEAGRSLGLSWTQTMISIVMPQAIKNILPALGNEFIVLVKETAIVGTIAVMDVTKAAQNIGSITFDYLPPLLITAAMYFVVVVILTKLLNAFERRLAQSDRR
jgi:polar amino acid transport system permease protein